MDISCETFLCSYDMDIIYLVSGGIWGAADISANLCLLFENFLEFGRCKGIGILIKR